MIRPFDISYASIDVDLWVMLAFAGSIWPLLYFKMKIGRKRGLTLLVAYGLYVALLFI